MSARDRRRRRTCARRALARLPEGAPLYDSELLTIHPERFLAAERIREKVVRQTERGGALRHRGDDRALGGRSEGETDRASRVDPGRARGAGEIVIGAGRNDQDHRHRRAHRPRGLPRAARVPASCTVQVEERWRETPASSPSSSARRCSATSSRARSPPYSAICQLTVHSPQAARGGGGEHLDLQRPLVVLAADHAHRQVEGVGWRRHPR